MTHTRIIFLVPFFLFVFSPLSTHAADLTAAQVQSILSVLSSFGADNTTIAQVNAALTGTPSTTTTSPCSFTRDLTAGSAGADVTCLQQALINGGYRISAGATGYFGAQTQTAVIAWQKASNVLPAAGYFGARSRAVFNNTAANSTIGGATTTNVNTVTPAPLPPTTQTTPDRLTQLQQQQTNQTAPDRLTQLQQQQTNKTAAAPFVSLISPSVVSANQSSAITLYGANFQNGAIISYSGTTSGSLPSIFVSPTQLTFSSSFAVGFYTFKVTNPDGQISSSGASITVSAGTATNTYAPTPTPTPANADPGFNSQGHTWTGLWVPKTLADGTPNPGYGTPTPELVVVDPSGPLGAGNHTIVPGCANQGDEAYSAPCNTAGYISSTDSATGTGINFSFSAGRILAVRYWSNSAAGAYYQLYDNQGFNAPSGAITSLSLKPGDFNVDAQCKMGNSANPYVTYGSGYCNPPYTANTPYYINITMPAGCSGVHCAFTIMESAYLQ